MKKSFVNLIKLFLSIIITLFIEEYFFKCTSLIGLKLTETAFIKLIIYIIEFIIIYIIYKDEINSGFSKYQNKFANNILTTLISFIILFIAMMITNYIVKLIAANLSVTYHGLNYINVFEKNFDLDLIVVIIKDIIIVPFVIVSIFVLGINNLIGGKTSSLLSGAAYYIYNAFVLGGKFSNLFIDVIDEFVLVFILSYIYKKNNNIAFSIVTFILYELFAGVLVNRFL